MTNSISLLSLFFLEYHTVNVLAYTRMMGNGSMDQAVVVLVNDSVFAYFDQENKTFALRPSASAGFSVLEKRDSIFCLGEVTKGFYRQAEYLEKLKEETNSSKPLLGKSDDHHLQVNCFCFAESFTNLIILLVHSTPFSQCVY